MTNAQYGQFLAATGHAPPVYWLDKNLNALQQPVVGVTWQDALDFAKWLSQVSGEEYRLPTEAEWEAACRGGLTGQPFPWGGQPPEQGGRFLANYNPKPYDKDGFHYPAPVGSFPPNGHGLYDMAGNVAEWCQDWYDPTYYSRSPIRKSRWAADRYLYASSGAAPGMPWPGSCAARPGSFTGHPGPMASSVSGWCVQCPNNPLTGLQTVSSNLLSLGANSANIYRL